VYLDLQKDNLYCNAPDAPERRSCQEALKIILITLVKLLTPILAYTCEDIYKYIKQAVPEEKAEFAALTDLPQVQPEFIDKALEEKYERVLKIKDEVYKAIEAKRAEKSIASSTEAAVSINAPDELIKDITAAELENFLIVSKVTIQTGALKAEVQKAGGEKCARCWRFFANLNAEKICPRCAAAVSSAQ
jgi:isoleucyl-tRNA synthetase